MSRSQPRGTTLIELMISVGILIIVVAITLQVVIAGVNLARNGNETGESNEAARLAGDTIGLKLRLAGMGATAGLNVVIGGTTRTVAPIIGVNSSTGPDELWVVTPSSTTFGQGCADTSANAATAGDTNAAAVVQESRTDGLIKVRCVRTLPAAGGLFMVTNLTSAALITVTGYTTSGSGNALTYAESGQTGFTNNYRRGGFAAGDLVVPVTISHYFLQNSGPNNEPTLMVADGKLNTVAGGFPFVEVANTRRTVLGPIEDLQLTFGVDPSDSDNPSSIAWQHGFGGAQGTWTAGLRSVGLTLVSRSHRTLRDTAGNGNLDGLKPLSVQDHLLTNPVADGLRRVIYERRIELPNAAPWNL